MQTLNLICSLTKEPTDMANPSYKKCKQYLLISLTAMTMLTSCNKDAPNQASSQPIVIVNTEKVADYINIFVWALPSTVLPPTVPAENPISNEKVKLGRFLFYDRQLSANSSQACADCHQQKHAFSESKSTAIGSTGQTHPRNSQALVNTAFNETLTWNNPSLHLLEKQITLPLFGKTPVEMGLSDDNKQTVLTRFQQDVIYQKLFTAAYPQETTPINYDNIIQSLASFVRTLNSFESAFDHYQDGNSSALSNSAQRGMTLFFSERLACTQCHGGKNFNDVQDPLFANATNRLFQNIGLFNIDDTGKYPSNNQGLIQFSHQTEDMGKFRVPTLRNIEFSAPYMHDGSFLNLEDVLDFYAAGGRLIDFGENTGDGRLNPFKSPVIKGFALDAQDKKDIVNFLKSLSDVNFITDSNLSKPFELSTKEK